MMPSARRLWSGAETAPPRPGRTAAPAALFPGLESVTEFLCHANSFTLYEGDYSAGRESLHNRSCRAVCECNELCSVIIKVLRK